MPQVRALGRARWWPSFTLTPSALPSVAISRAVKYASRLPWPSLPSGHFSMQPESARIDHKGASRIRARRLPSPGIAYAFVSHAGLFLDAGAGVDGPFPPHEVARLMCPGKAIELPLRTRIDGAGRENVTMKGKHLTITETLEMARLPPVAADDIRLTTAVAELVNDAYEVAGERLWANGARRTTAEEIALFTRARQVAVARVGRQVVGCVRVKQLRQRYRGVWHARRRPELSRHGRGTRNGAVRRTSRA